MRTFGVLIFGRTLLCCMPVKRRMRFKYFFYRVKGRKNSMKSGVFAFAYFLRTIFLGDKQLFTLFL